MLQVQIPPCTYVPLDTIICYMNILLLIIKCLPALEFGLNINPTCPKTVFLTFDILLISINYFINSHFSSKE